MFFPFNHKMTSFVPMFFHKIISLLLLRSLICTTALFFSSSLVFFFFFSSTTTATPLPPEQLRRIVLRCEPFENLYDPKAVLVLGDSSAPDMYPCPELVIRNVHVYMLSSIDPVFAVLQKLSITDSVFVSSMDIRASFYNINGTLSNNNNNNNNLDPVVSFHMKNVTVLYQDIDPVQTKAISINQRLVLSPADASDKNRTFFRRYSKQMDTASTSPFVQFSRTWNESDFVFLRRNFLDSFIIENCTAIDPTIFYGSVNQNTYPFIEINQIRVGGNFVFRNNVLGTATKITLFMTVFSLLEGATMHFDDNKFTQNDEICSGRLSSNKTYPNPDCALVYQDETHLLYLRYINSLEQDVRLAEGCSLATGLLPIPEGTTPFYNDIAFRSKVFDRSFLAASSFVRFSNNNFSAVIYLDTHRTLLVTCSIVSLGNHGGITFYNNTATIDQSNAPDGNFFAKDIQSFNAVEWSDVGYTAYLRIINNSVTVTRVGKLTGFFISGLMFLFDGIFVSGNVVKMRCSGQSASSTIGIEMYAYGRHISNIIVTKNHFDLYFNTSLAMLSMAEMLATGGAGATIPIKFPDILEGVSGIVEVSENVATVFMKMPETRISVVTFVSFLIRSLMQDINKIFIHDNKMFVSGEAQQLVGVGFENRYFLRIGNVTVANNYFDCTNLKFIPPVGGFVLADAFGFPKTIFLGGGIVCATFRYTVQLLAMLFLDNAGADYTLAISNTIIFQLPTYDANASLSIVQVGGSFTLSSEKEILENLGKNGANPGKIGDNYTRYNTKMRMDVLGNKFITAKPTLTESKKNNNNNNNLLAVASISILVVGAFGDELATVDSVLVEGNSLLSDFGGTPHIFAISEGPFRPTGTRGLVFRNNTVRVKHYGRYSASAIVMVATAVTPAVWWRLTLVYCASIPRVAAAFRFLNTRMEFSSFVVEDNTFEVEDFAGTASLVLFPPCNVMFTGKLTPDANDQSCFFRPVSSSSNTNNNNHRQIIFKNNKMRVTFSVDPSLSSSSSPSSSSSFNVFKANSFFFPQHIVPATSTLLLSSISPTNNINDINNLIFLFSQNIFTVGSNNITRSFANSNNNNNNCSFIYFTDGFDNSGPNYKNPGVLQRTSFPSQIRMEKNIATFLSPDCGVPSSYLLIDSSLPPLSSTNLTENHINFDGTFINNNIYYNNLNRSSFSMIQIPKSSSTASYDSSLSPLEQQNDRKIIIMSSNILNISSTKFQNNIKNNGNFFVASMIASISPVAPTITSPTKFMLDLSGNQLLVSNFSTPFDEIVNLSDSNSVPSSIVRQEDSIEEKTASFLHVVQNFAASSDAENSGGNSGNSVASVSLTLDVSKNPPCNILQATTTTTTATTKLVKINPNFDALLQFYSSSNNIIGNLSQARCDDWFGDLDLAALFHNTTNSSSNATTDPPSIKGNAAFNNPEDVKRLEVASNALSGINIFAATVVSSVVPTLGFSVSRQQAMVDLLQKMNQGDCSGVSVVKDPNTGDSAIAAADSPTQMEIGFAESDARFYVGGAVGNVVLVAGIVLLCQSGGYAFLRYTSKTPSSSSTSARNNRNKQRISLYHVFARCHGAMILFICLSLLFAPSFKFGLVILPLANSDVNIAQKILGAIFGMVIFGGVTGFYVVKYLFLRERKEVYVKNPIQKNAKSSVFSRLFAFWFEGPGEWRMPIAKKVMVEEKKLHNNKNNRSATRNRQDSSPKRQEAQKVFKKIRITEAENLDFEVAAPLVDGFQRHAWYFGAVDFLVQAGLAVAEFSAQIAPVETSCVTQAIVLLIVFACHVVLCLWLRPFQELFNRIFTPISTLFEMAIVSIALYYSSNSDALPGFLFNLAMVSVSMQSAIVLIVLGVSLSPLFKQALRVYKKIVSIAKKKNNNNHNNSRNNRNSSSDNKNNNNRRLNLENLRSALEDDIRVENRNNNNNDSRSKTNNSSSRNNFDSRNRDRQSEIELKPMNRPNATTSQSGRRPDSNKSSNARNHDLRRESDKSKERTSKNTNQERSEKQDSTKHRNENNEKPRKINYNINSNRPSSNGKSKRNDSNYL